MLRFVIDGFEIRAERGFYRVAGFPFIFIEKTTPIRIDPFSQKMAGPYFMAAWYVKRGINEWGNGIKRQVPAEFADKDSKFFLMKNPGSLKSFIDILENNRKEVVQNEMP